MIDVNVIPVAVLTRQLMTQMLNRKNGKKSAVIFVASCQVITLFAGHTVYGPTKRYMDTLAKAVYHENKGRMDAMSYQLGLTSTKMVGHYRENIMCISARQAAMAALSDIGYEFMSEGHWKHEICNWVLRKAYYFFPN